MRLPILHALCYAIHAGCGSFRYSIVLPRKFGLRPFLLSCFVQYVMLSHTYKHKFINNLLFLCVIWVKIIELLNICIAINWLLKIDGGIKWRSEMIRRAFYAVKRVY